MTAERVTRGVRLFVLAGVGWFVCWQAAVVLGAGRPVAVVLGLYGFVLHTVFGKAYALVPSYFDRELAFPNAPALQLPFSVGGTALLAVDAAGVAPVRVPGVAAWALGCSVFLGALGWSLRDNLSGRETATSDAKADRRGIDRLANAFVPVAFGYLLAGAALPVLASLGGPTPVAPAGPPLTHLLAVGAAVLLVFALGCRLLPRFLVVSPSRPLVAVVLPAGALGPLLLATGFGGGPRFRLGAALQTVALLGFAFLYADMYRRSDRRRLGLRTVGIAVGFGAAVGLLGLSMAATGIRPAVAEAHARLGLLGFLALVVVGVSYQFYPPTVAGRRWIDDRTAAAAVALLAGGVALEAGGWLLAVDALVGTGRSMALLGAAVHGVVVAAVLETRS